ncbi:hypothetical protein FJZ36_17500 [Candidatus Poribacteria bacterium]|nr:hypothetical protein [Candidatus Poribacteria bacterium]
MGPERPHLLTTTKTPLGVASFLAQTCTVTPTEVSMSSTDTQAWHVLADGQPYFAKWAAASVYAETLAKDADICSKRLHPAIVRLLNRVETADGTLLVYERIYGEDVRTLAKSRRIYDMALEKRLRLLATTYDALAVISDDGWVFVDFYDGNVLYDAGSDTTMLFDFELFRRCEGYTLELDRNYGSSRLMAPEEFQRGAWIDGRTNVYTLGRLAIVVLCREIDERWRSVFPASAALAEVIERATQPDPERRYGSVRQFVTAYRHASPEMSPIVAAVHAST